MQDVEPRVYRLVLGKVVAALRKQRGISQETFALLINVSQPTLSRIERGQSMPDALTIRRIATALDLSTDELHRYVDNALERTRLAAAGATGRQAGISALKTALGVAGLVGLAGLVGFAIAALLAEEEDEA